MCMSLMSRDASICLLKKKKNVHIREINDVIKKMFNEKINVK